MSFTSELFPALISCYQLSAMIEADTSDPGIATNQSSVTSHPALSSEYMLQRRKSFISFDVFREEYWAHFPQSLTKGLGPSHYNFLRCILFIFPLDVSLVFSEFMGNYHARYRWGSFVDYTFQVSSKAPKRPSIWRIISSIMTPIRISAHEPKLRSRASVTKFILCSKYTWRRSGVGWSRRGFKLAWRSPSKI